MKKVDIFSVFLFITVSILVCGFSFTKVSAAENVAFIEVNEDIIEDTIWSETSKPYVVTDSIFVEEGATLTIEPGVVVKFMLGTDLYITGKIIAEGEDNEDGRIYFTSNYDDIGGSTDDDFEDCEYDLDDNIIEGTCVYEDWDEPYSEDWDGFYIYSSVGSSFKNVFFQYTNDALYIESSDVSFENLNIKDSITGITGYNESTVNIKGGNFENILDAFDFFNNSSLSVEDITLKNVVTGFTGFTGSYYYEDHPEVIPYSNSYITIKNSTLDCTGDGITIFNNYNLKIKGGSISCEGDGVTLFNDVTAEIDGVKIIGKIAEGDTEPTNVGIIAFENTIEDAILVKNSEITGNEYGFQIWDSLFSAHRNSIHDNFISGVDTFTNILLDFTSNFWGDKTGPKNETSNPTGLGDVISDNITFTPFLKYDPTKENISNVMFIPGFQASRLYKMEGNISLGTEFEKIVWEPGVLGGPSDMYMDEKGESIDKDIYTREVMGKANLLGIGVKNFYKSFFDKLDVMVTDGEMASWKAVAYDWRFSPLDIVRRGTEDNDGNISYTEELTNEQVPYIIGELQKLVDTSNSDKVTIVTHSNGGLVAKALIAKLIDMKSDLIDHIDNLVVVAPPLVGTPKATAGVLHGYDQGVFFNLLLNKKDARDFGQTLSGAYGLLPSEEYLSEVNTNIILLDPSLDKLNNWRSTYGDAIDTYEELKNFLLDNLRINPRSNDLVNPTILNKNILDKAELLHDTIDTFEIPETIKVHQVAGFGLPTVSEIQYKSKNECSLFIFPICLKKKVVLSVDAGFTSGGDATVVGESALFGDGEKYYLNLEEYNKDEQEGKIFYSGKDHANIFEVPYVYDLVHNILKADNSFPSYITDTAPSPVDYTIIKMRSPVAIDIYDESGLHTGITEGIDEGEDSIEEGIPNSSYMEIGENKYIVVSKEGNYILKLDGLSDGIFTLEQEQLVNDMPGDSVVWRDIPTTALFKGEVALNGGILATSIAMDEDGDGVFESNLSPIDKSLDEEKDDIIRGSSGSYIIKDMIFPKVILEKEDDIKLKIIEKEESIPIVKNLEKKEEVKSAIIVNNTDRINPMDNQAASAGLLSLDKRLILLLNIVLSGLIIIVGIKFINKVK